MLLTTISSAESYKSEFLNTLEGKYLIVDNRVINQEDTDASKPGFPKVF